MLSDTASVFEQYRDTLERNVKEHNREQDLVDIVQEVNDLKGIVDEIKKMDSDKILEVDVDSLKKDVDALQGRSLKVFQELMAKK